jgi:hypothetical protein
MVIFHASSFLPTHCAQSAFLEGIMRLWFFVILLALCGAANVSATTLHVPSEYPTIQSACDASAIGDSVLIAPGLYSGGGMCSITLHCRVSIIGDGALGSVIIDCGGTQNAIDARHGELYLENVTIVNGGAARSQGVVWLSDAFLRNCVIDNSSGCSIFIDVGATVRIHDSIVRNSRAALYDGNIHGSNTSILELSRCQVIDNADDGVGLDNTSTTIDNCLIARNGSGGAWNYGVGTYKGSLIMSNTAIVDGSSGGLWVGSTPSARLTNVTISGNIKLGDGSGIVISQSNVYLDHSIVWGNTGSPNIRLLSGSFASACSDFPSDSTEGDNISMDPLFCNPSNGGYSLRDVSPALTQTCGSMGAYTQSGCVTPTSIQPTTWSAIKAQYR